jgi:hypothetical protein
MHPALLPHSTNENLNCHPMRRRRQAPAIPHTVWLLRFCIVITGIEYSDPPFPPVTSTGDKKTGSRHDHFDAQTGFEILAGDAWPAVPALIESSRDRSTPRRWRPNCPLVRHQRTEAHVPNAVASAGSRMSERSGDLR